MVDIDDPDYQEAASEARFARRRMSHQIRHYDYRDPEYLPEEEDENDES